MRALEDVALGVIVAAVLMGSVAFVAVRLAGWRDPESESEFDEIVRHSERSRAKAWPSSPRKASSWSSIRSTTSDFEELVRDALDDLPDLLRNALATSRW